MPQKRRRSSVLPPKWERIIISTTINGYLWEKWKLCAVAFQIPLSVLLAQNLTSFLDKTATAIDALCAKLPKGGVKSKVSFILSKELSARLDEVADKDRWSHAELISAALAGYLLTLGIKPFSPVSREAVLEALR